MAGLGLSITFGIMGIINFAHGEFMMLGAYTVYVMQKIFYSSLGESYFLISIPMAFLVTAFIGFLMEKGLIRFLYGRPFESILVTWGLSLLLQQAARNIFGASNVEIISPKWLTQGISLTSTIQLPYNRLFIIGLAIIVILGMYYYIYKSSSGRRMRAVMQNRSMGAFMGINTDRVDSLTFSIGCGLAGISGSIVSLLGSVGPSTGQNYIIDSFMVVVLGGVGSLIGTISGSLLMGFASPLFEFITTSSMGKVIVFTMVILFLQYKPSGFLTLKTRSLD